MCKLPVTIYYYFYVPFIHFWHIIKEDISGMATSAAVSLASYSTRMAAVLPHWPRVQTPGYIPKKPGWFFWVYPPKKPANKTHQKTHLN